MSAATATETTTPDVELLAARQMGATAYATPDAPCAPGADAALLLLIGDVPVGQGRTTALMREWTAGWHAAADTTAWAALTEPPC